MTPGDNFLTLGDMSSIRGSSLQGFSELVEDLGADPWGLLADAAIDPAAVGDPESLIATRSVLSLLEHAARTTGALDLGRRLALRQGIEILGVLGIAARSSSTVGGALAAVDEHLATYSPELLARVDPQPTERFARFEWRLRTQHALPHQQSAELGLGVALRIFRVLADDSFTPDVVVLGHPPLGDPAAYVEYFGCPVRFDTGRHGFLFRRRVLERPLSDDVAVHQLALHHLTAQSIPVDVEDRSPAAAVRRMLPTGTVSLEQVAAQLAIHPRSLQRQLAAEGTTYQQLVDDIRRDEAAHLLRDTDLPLAQIAHLLGYTEQSVFSRSCTRWFGASPSRTRASLRQPQLS